MLRQRAKYRLFRGVGELLGVLSKLARIFRGAHIASNVVPISVDHADIALGMGYLADLTHILRRLDVLLLPFCGVRRVADMFAELILPGIWQR